MINNIHFRLFTYFLLAVSLPYTAAGQKVVTEPWTENQLILPEVLVAIINNPHAQKPVIYSIGPGATVKGSIDIGPVQEKENLKNLKQQLALLQKGTSIVIYCGCCPFDKCPNIRPAFQLLNDMHFINHKLLYLPKSIKADWIDKNYPVNN